jgi:threonine dehydrogenase-like Zn-dependent dehydrogenase
VLLETFGTTVAEGTFVITHRLKLEQAPESYKAFRDKKDGYIKVMLQPGT